MDGRRFAGEREQPIAGRVHGEIDENVDLVFADALRKLLIARPHCRPPLVRQRLQSLGDRIGMQHVAVAEDFKRFMVVMGENRLDEKRDGVVTKVG